MPAENGETPPSEMSMQNGEEPKSGVPEWPMPEWLTGWLQIPSKYLGQVQKPLITIAGALYIVGYLGWCLFAWLNNVSLLPVLSSQYIMSGGILGLFFFGIFGLLYWQKRVNDTPSKENRITRWLIFVAPSFTFLVLLITVSVLLNTRSAFDGWRQGFVVFLIIMGAASYLLLVPIPTAEKDVECIKKLYSNKLNDPLKKQLDKFCDTLAERVSSIEPNYDKYRKGTIRVLYIVGSVIMYLAFLSLPQQVGGARSRCAHLFIDKDTLPPGLREQMMSGPNLRVIFEGNDTIFVRTSPSPGGNDSEPSASGTSTNDNLPRRDGKTPSAKPENTKQPKTTNNSSSSPKVYEVSRRIVQAIDWCDD